MVFRYDPGAGHAQFAERGFVHLKNVLTAEFLSSLRKFYEASQRDPANEKSEWKILGKKRQFLFEFPSHETAIAFRTGMAGLTGINPKDFTISERHLKVYDASAPPWLSPHKDRSASEISIGLPIRLPKGSSACMFPNLQSGPNLEDHAVFLESDTGTDPEELYQSEGAVMLNEQVGDVIVFLGSAIFHERVRAAGTAVLYIKVNGTGQDPLGENIYETASGRGPHKLLSRADGSPTPIVQRAY